MADLKRKSVRGGAVTLLSQGGKLGIQMVSTIVLARLLTPEDFGVLAMVLVFTSFARLFRDLGLSSAAIQKKSLTLLQQSNLFWLNVLMGLTLTAIVAASSPLVAMFYGRPELVQVTLVISLSFIIGSFGAQFGAMLVRRMQFGRQAWATLGGDLVGLIVSIALAVLGYRYWALVWGSLAGVATTTVLLVVFSPFRPVWISRGSGTRGMLNFGANLTAFNFINYFHRNLDNILIGKFWGAEALGIYSKAYSLLMLPLHAIRNPINAVAFPALSKLQQHPAAYRSYYRRINSVVAFLSMPLCAYMFVGSAPLIDLALGDGWDEVSPIYSILAVAAFIQPTAGLRGMIMMSMGRGKAYLGWGIFNAVAVSLGFLIGLKWGAIGVASAYAIVNYMILYPSLVMAFKNTPVQKRDFFQPLARPAAASMLGAAVALVVRENVEFAHPAYELAILGLAFVAAFLLSFCLIPGGTSELKEYIKLSKLLNS